MKPFPRGVSLSTLVALSSVICGQISEETFKLLPSDGSANDNFGISVGVSGTTTIIGSYWDDDLGLGSGSVYLFDTQTGLQTAKLLPNDGAALDGFGISVAIDGSMAIVGSAFDDDNGPESGSAYLFETSTGQQVAKLLASDGADNAFFGCSVSISGTTAIVGSFGDDGNGFEAGAAYLFDTVTGLQLAKLTSNDGVDDDKFGMSVAICGTTAIVGATGNDAAGSAYLFETTSGQLIAKVKSDNGAAGDMFGAAVDISPTTAIVGAPFADDNGSASGTAYLFDAANGYLIARLLASDGTAGDTFGYSVAISNTAAIVGANGDDDPVNASGTAYLFSTGASQQLAKLIPSTPETNGGFGFSTALNDATAVIGANRTNENGVDSGSAFVVELEAATTALNNGQGSNPIILSDGGSAPALGLVWPAMVDSSLSDLAISSCVWFEGSLPPGSLIIAGGEVIVDPTTNLFFSSMRSGPSPHDYSVLVPLDVSIVGTDLSAQAILISSGPTFCLGNAIDLNLGF